MTHRVVIAAIAVVAVAVTPLMMFAASVPSVGSLAPDFSLTSQEGTPVSLKDYRDKLWESALSTLTPSTTTFLCWYCGPDQRPE